MSSQPSDRRDFLKASLATSVILAAAPRAFAAESGPATHTPLRQPALPFAMNALDPVISEKTIGFHYGKHHKGYFDNLAKLVAGSAFADSSLEDIIRQTAGDKEKAALFNNAAQAWNHNFYWQSLTPQPHLPTGALAAAIDRDFGSLDTLKKTLASVTTGQFGSGWGWLVVDNGKLAVISSSNADLPFIHGQHPLLTIDIWEHAYYLDYQNRRADYVAAVIDKTLNWEFADMNFANL